MKYQDIRQKVNLIEKILFSRNQILIGASWYFSEKVIKLFGAVLVGAWVARYLGPDSYGTLAYALGVISVASFVGSFGIEGLVIRDLILNQINKQRIISTYFFIRLAGSFFVPIIVLGYYAVTKADYQLQVVTMICGLTILLGAFDVTDCLLQSQNQAKSTSIIKLVGFCFSAFIKIIFILKQAELIYFAAAFVLESFVISLLYFQFLNKNGLVPRFKTLDIKIVVRLLKHGKFFILSGLINAIYSKLDLLILGLLIPTNIFAPYALAFGMCGAWNMLGMSVAQAWAPRITNAKFLKKTDYIFELRYLLFAMFFLSVCGSLFITYFADTIFGILYGEIYSTGANALRILIWSSVPIYLGIATNQIIVIEELYSLSLLRTAFGVCTSFFMLFPAVDIYGINGAAFAVVASAWAAFSLTFSSKICRSQIFLAILKPNYMLEK